MRGRPHAALAVAFLAVSTIGCGGGDSAASARPSGTVAPSASPGIGPTATSGPGAGTAGPTAAPSTAAVPTSGEWARIALDGSAPGAREDHTWTVGEDGSAYLFGGRDGATAFDDLWRFDLAADAWQRIQPAGAGPAPRFGHEAAWAPGLGLVVWAGQAGTTFYDDLWLYDPAGGTWRVLPSGGNAPIARYGSCSGIGPDGRLWISHGFTADGARFADTSAYDFEQGAWIDEAPSGSGPVERCLHACWWTTDGRFALYGGQTTGVAALGDLWLLAPGDAGASSNAWSEAGGDLPPARQLAAVARWNGVTIVVGGRGRDRAPLRDTWLLADGAAGFERLQTPGDVPPARSGAALVFDAPRDRLLLFGGLGEDELDDLWALSFPGR